MKEILRLFENKEQKIMLVCQIIGDVVSTTKSNKIEGFKLLVVQPVDVHELKPSGSPLVAVDTVGAGEGEYVLISQGSSARLTDQTQDKPVDAVICAILDYIEIEGKRTFSKGEA